MSMEKQWEVSNVLYGKWKKSASATITKPEANFDLGITSQVTPKLIDIEVVKTDVSVHPVVNMEIPKVDVKAPVLNFQQLEITVSPVINVHTSELARNEQGQLVLPLIKVALTININTPWKLDELNWVTFLCNKMHFVNFLSSQWYGTKCFHAWIIVKVSLFNLFWGIKSSQKIILVGHQSNRAESAIKRCSALPFEIWCVQCNKY